MYADLTKSARQVAHTFSLMYAAHEHAQHLCRPVLAMACPGFLTVRQGGMSTLPAVHRSTTSRRRLPLGDLHGQGRELIDTGKVTCLL